MADVKRPLNTLQSLYADNTTGDISPQDLRDGIKTINGNYYLSASSESIIYISANDIYVNVNTSAGTKTVILPSVSGSDSTGDTFRGKFYVFTNYAPSGSNNLVLSGSENINSYSSYIVPPNKTIKVVSNDITWNTIGYETSAVPYIGATANVNLGSFGFTTSGITDNTLSATTLLGTDSNKTIISLTSATYPTLAEIANVKGVTAPLQTQLNTRSYPMNPIVRIADCANLTQVYNSRVPSYYYYPVIEDCVISAIDMYMSTFTTSGVSFASIYTYDENATISLIQYGELTVTTSGWQRFVLTAPVSATRSVGRYFMSYMMHTGNVNPITRTGLPNHTRLAFAGATVAADAGTKPTSAESSRANISYIPYMEPR